jgi:hypothetical protein
MSMQMTKPEPHFDHPPTLLSLHLPPSPYLTTPPPRTPLLLHLPHPGALPPLLPLVHHHFKSHLMPFVGPEHLSVWVGGQRVQGVQGGGGGVVRGEVVVEWRGGRRGEGVGGGEGGLAVTQQNIGQS